jgi:hypothetical protein
VTSEVGRALIGLTILQLVVKSIVPEQSIRLHKAGKSIGTNFSWKEGLPMRSLDKSFITPVLRKHGLLRLNADGFMMTRTLAENYPYSEVYKAAMRGGRNEWLKIVELVETKKLDPKSALKELIALLMNKSEAFEKLSSETLAILKKKIGKSVGSKKIIPFIKEYVRTSAYSARVFEVAIHSLLQAVEDEGVIAGELIPLSQMRSANKKHGNVGDVEIGESRQSKQIIESWDAKYGKPYLRDELEELHEKLQEHPETTLAGFVTDGKPDLKKEIVDRAEEISSIHDVKIKILSFDEWIHEQTSLYALDEDDLCRSWILALAETICQKRRDRAPIDEPCDDWVKHFGTMLNQWKFD